MQYQTKILLLSFIMTVIISLFIIPILRKLKMGQMEREEGPESHLKKQGTTTMGGIAMIIVIILLTAFLAYDYGRKEQFNIVKTLIPLSVSVTGIGIVGLIDDLKKKVFKNTDGLKPMIKMLGLLIFAVGFVLYITQVLKIGTETYIPFKDIY